MSLRSGRGGWADSESLRPPTSTRQNRPSRLGTILPLPVNLRAAIGPEQLQFDEFEALLRAYDDRAVELIGPTPAP